MKEDQDAFGHQAFDFLQGSEVHEIIERDDGFVDVSAGPQVYFETFDRWPEFERRAMDYVRGNVLDIGCGAGRHALYLQENGFEVVGLDASPLAIEVCRLRGLRALVNRSVTQIDRSLGTFDTLLMLGNNFGLMGGERRARWLLKRFRAITSSSGRIVAGTMDPYETDKAEHVAYHQLNLRRGRMGGQVRIRVRYRGFKGAWMDYLFVSRQELEALLDGTGWEVTGTIDGDDARYVAIIDKL